MRRPLLLLVVLALLAVAAAPPGDGGPDAGGAVGARVELALAEGTATLTAGPVSRTWTWPGFQTAAIVDRRTGVETAPSPDFRLTLVDGAELTSRDFDVVAVAEAELPRGGREVTFTLAPQGLDLAGTVTRTVRAWPGVAGFETRTTVALPVAVTGYTLDEVAVGEATPTAHAFNAGYDWRGSDTPDWEPTLDPTGTAHTGDHRETTSAGLGGALDVPAQWLSLELGSEGDTDAPRVLLVPQRVNYDSTHVAYDGANARAHVDLADDLVYLGPFEADVHLDNPAPAPLRARTFSATAPVTLETTFLGLATDADDEPWQHHRYLTRARWSDWRVGDVTFNSNGVDEGRISTGAKDDMDLAEVERQAAVARRLGVETFILDDGWQAASGDWCPDSPSCPEPRGMYPDRFPDDTFTAVRDVLGDDLRLGLWMTPMHFNPASQAYRDNPEWACTPLGDGLAVYNTLEPDSSSNEAGLGTWNPLAVSLPEQQRLVDHIESRIERAIEVYGARYFKFDFLVWLDCVGKTATDTVDAYTYREAFVAMLDRLIARHPGVTFQIDETNDYRLFPFESASRGPSWYANGSPTVDQALHNLWVLAPYVPGATIGQDALGKDRRRFDVGYVMSAALGSHVTFFDDLTHIEEEIGAEGIAEAARWVELYREHRDRFTSMAYPLLDDPIGGTTWTALQPWDREAQRGALLVYRQDAEGDVRSVPLRGIVGDGAFVVRDAVTDAVVGTFTADELRAGIPVTLPERHSSAVWLIDPA